MVKITYNPIKEIVINEIIKSDNIEKYEEIFLPALKAGAQVVVKWADGVSFDYNCYPPIEITFQERLKGVLYIDALRYTLMPEYQSTRTIEPPEGGIFYLGITNVSGTSNLLELAKWIKQHDKSKE